MCLISMSKNLITGDILTYILPYTLTIRYYSRGNWRWRDSGSAENNSCFHFIYHCFLFCQDSYCKGKIMHENKKSLVNNKTKEHTSLLLIVKVYHYNVNTQTLRHNVTISTATDTGLDNQGLFPNRKYYFY